MGKMNKYQRKAYEKRNEYVRYLVKEGLPMPEILKRIEKRYFIKITSQRVQQIIKEK